MATRDAGGMTQLYRFGPFELDVRAGELRKYGTRIRLQEQPLRILTMLLARPGEAVLRDEIQQALWPNRTMVEFDQGINAAIKRLRTALAERGGSRAAFLYGFDLLEPDGEDLRRHPWEIRRAVPYPKPSEPARPTARSKRSRSG